MREIKFRAWDLKCNHMVYEDLCVGEGTVLSLEPGYEFNEWREQRVYIPMQFTGLKDKNGKEIYEGDVVRQLVESKTRGEEEKEWIREVPEFPARLFHQVGEGFFSAEDVEVIGNIYENPELLTK